MFSVVTMCNVKYVGLVNTHLSTNKRVQNVVVMVIIGHQCKHALNMLLLLHGGNTTSVLKDEEQHNLCKVGA